MSPTALRHGAQRVPPAIKDGLPVEKKSARRPNGFIQKIRIVTNVKKGK